MTTAGSILKALDFAARRHSSQLRKGEIRIPYINHPIQVANLLVNECGEEDVVLLSAAILHDVIEDTVNSVDERAALIEVIRMEFGEEILLVTLEVTDDKTLEKLERKRLQIIDGPHKSVAAKKLKIADKIMNVRDMTYNPPVDWPLERIVAYLDWSEQVVNGIRGVSPRLDKLFDETLKEAKAYYSHH